MALNDSSTELVSFLNPQGQAVCPRVQRTPPHRHDISQKSSASWTSLPSHDSLGMPTRKKRIHLKDMLTVSLSFLCLAAAVTVVANEEISWRLAIGTRQLILLGFFLSIMNLCLSSITPILFLHLEARLGPSTLQNYDGILRTQMFASRLTFTWRLVLASTLLLPLGLSASYKTFLGGESKRTVQGEDYFHAPSLYGMFGPPGMQSYGKNTGPMLFSNSTLSFVMGSTSITKANTTAVEPDIPPLPKAYGFNILLLNNGVSAVLDIPQPDYVSGVQSLLSPGESWMISASVIGTVATYNDTKTTNPKGYNSTFMSRCKAAKASSAAFGFIPMYDLHTLVLVDHPGAGDMGYQYIAFSPDEYSNYDSCADVSHLVDLCDVTRRLCKGTWLIDRGNIQLITGSCNDTDLPGERQLVITDNLLFLPNFFMPSLVEFMGVFATARNQSEWKIPYLATGIAAMLWSRISMITSPSNLARFNGTPTFTYSREFIDYNVSYADAGIIYPVNDTAVYIRPTLHKSGWLYFVLAIQPLLTLVSLLVIAAMHSTPVDEGFGMISILSGINPECLQHLSGAALSGGLVNDVKLIIRPYQDGNIARIKYDLLSSSTEEQEHNRKLDKNVTYY